MFGRKRRKQEAEQQARLEAWEQPVEAQVYCDLWTSRPVAKGVPLEEFKDIILECLDSSPLATLEARFYMLDSDGHRQYEQSIPVRFDHELELDMQLDNIRIRAIVRRRQDNVEAALQTGGAR